MSFGAPENRKRKEMMDDGESMNAGPIQISERRKVSRSVGLDKSSPAC